jgi:stage III sporulation protein AE
LKNKGFIKFLFFFLFFLSLFSTSVFASEELDSLKEFSQQEEIWNLLPNQIDQNKLKNAIKEKNGTGILPFLADEILDYFTLSIKTSISFFGGICALILLAALFRSIKDSFASAELESSFHFLLFCGIALILYSSFSKTCDSVFITLGEIRNFFLASLPITTFLLALSGSVTQSSLLAANISQTLALSTTLISNFLSPILKMLFAFLVLDGIFETGLKSFFHFFKKSIKTLCILFFTLVAGTLSLQNALATSADSLAQRTVRFASGNFIPVIGGIVGQSMSTITAAFSVVKAECGVLSIILLAILILRPILAICVQKVFLSLAGAIADLTGEKKCRLFLDSFRSLLDLLLALMISEGCYLIFYITLFLTSRGGV